MKICVLGAGVVGVSTAYALGRQGHEVIVIDKGEGVANGASHANGAQLSYSYVDPFAGPAAFKKLPAYLLGGDPGVRLGLSLSPSYLRWGLSFIRNCSNRLARQNLITRWQMAQASQAAMVLFESELPKGSLARTGAGKIILAKSDTVLASMAKGADTKRELGLTLSALNRSECLAREPSLEGWTGDFAGGLYSGDDTTLDPIVYCKALKSYAETTYGVRFLWGETVSAVENKSGSVSGIRTDKNLHTCDAVIICLGAQSNDILKLVGLSVPIYPLRGYSLTLPAKLPELQTSITDPDNKIVFANLGDRVRIAGFMDANQSPDNIPNRIQQLLGTAKQLWPSIADYDAKPHSWTQCRPMVPSGVPIIGPSRLSGLYLNVGHGALGYTFAAGSAMKIAQHMGGLQVKPELTIEGQSHDLRI